MNNNSNSEWVMVPEPTSKHLDEFTGKGWEIFGDPNHKESGQIHSYDGQIDILRGHLKPVERNLPREISDFCQRLENNSIVKTEKELKREREFDEWEKKRLPPFIFTTAENFERWGKYAREQERLKANEFGTHFAKAILDGDLHKFAKAIVKQFDRQNDVKKAADKKSLRKRGYEIALSAVCAEAKHPREITIHAIKSHFAKHRRYKTYSDFDLVANDPSIADLKDGLKNIGFGWLPTGTPVK